MNTCIHVYLSDIPVLFELCTYRTRYFFDP